MSAFLSILPAQCPTFAAGMLSIAGSKIETAYQTDTNRDVTPQAAFPPLITAASMLGKCLVSWHAHAGSNRVPAQRHFGDSIARNGFGEGMT